MQANTVKSTAAPLILYCGILQKKREGGQTGFERICNRLFVLERDDQRGKKTVLMRDDVKCA